MPGFDGTGPMGQGPRTGGGRGFCYPGAGPTPYGAHAPFGAGPYRGFPYGGYPYGGTAYVSYPYGAGFGAGRGGFPRGGGRGRAFGGGRYRWWAYPGAMIAPEQELELLKHQAQFLNQQVESIAARIKVLEKQEDT